MSLGTTCCICLAVPTEVLYTYEPTVVVFLSHEPLFDIILTRSWSIARDFIYAFVGLRKNR